MNLKRTKTSKIKNEKPQTKSPSAFEKLVENSQKSFNLLNGIMNNNNEQRNNFTYQIIKNCINYNTQKTSFLNDSSQKHLGLISENESFNSNSKKNSLHSFKTIQRDSDLNNSLLNLQMLINNNDENINQNDSKNLSLNLIKKISLPINISQNKSEYNKKFNLSICDGSPTHNQRSKRKSGFSMLNYKNIQPKLSMNQNDEIQELSLKNSEKSRVNNFFSFWKTNNKNGKRNERKRSVIRNKRVKYISMQELYIEYPKLKKVLHKLKILYFLCCLFAIFSFVFACVDNEIYNVRSWKYLEKKYYLTNYNKSKIFNETIIIDIKNRKITNLENMIRILNGICSILICILLIVKFKYKRTQIEKNTKEIIRENEEFKNDKKFYTKSLFDLRIKNDKKSYLFLKLLISIIFYPPFVNSIIIQKFIFGGEIIIYAYSLNSIFVLINISKLVIIILYILEFSRYNSIVSKKYCHNKIKANSEFRAKGIFQKFPIITCFIISAAIVILVTISKRYFDAFSNTIKYESEDIYSPYPLNEIFFALSAQSHHWFGDYESVTLISKIILYIGATFGMVTLSVWSFYFNSNILELNSEEKKAYTKLVKLRNHENKEHKATNLIKEFLRFRKLYINFNNLIDKGSFDDYGINIKMFLKEKFIVKIKFRMELKYFKNEGKIARNYSLPLYDLLNSLEKKMDENIDSCNNQIDKLFEVRNTFISFQYNFQIITQTIIEIKNQSDLIYEYLKQFFNEYYLQFTTITKPKLLKKQKQLLLKQRKSSDSKSNIKIKRSISKKHERLSHDKFTKSGNNSGNSFINNYLKRKVFNSTIKKCATEIVLKKKAKKNEIENHF